MSAPSIVDAARAFVPSAEADSPLAGARLRAARARFAASLDGANSAHSATLGTVILRADQLRALRRVQAHLARDGGCLLADDVGTGKTYVALAVAREWSSPLVVVPASLRPTWRDAIARAGVRCEVVSHESLSRHALPPGEHDGIIVDESHRFRPTAHRHATLARLAARAPLLLLSATPLQNRTRELAAQLALFLGDAAYRLSADDLARYVVRGAPLAEPVQPRVAPPGWLDVRANDAAVLHAILALPPPPRAIDAGDGGALLVISLVRAWSSSRAALLATVRRRRQTLVAMEQCFDEGRAPTRAELRSWRGGGGVQLGFAALLAATTVEREPAGALARSLERERAGLDALLGIIERAEDPDVARVAALRAVRAAHPAAAILAFSESASTVRAYYSAMRADAGVGMLTAREARIASGRLPRAELLAAFAPRAQGARTPASHERVTLMLATDLLSEGVNLQDASVVVHLDLPWNPARLAQRLGRVRRPGGQAEVHGYLMTPPADAALLLRAESRLRAKLARAERIVGRGLDVMPALSPERAVTLGETVPPSVSTPATACDVSDHTRSAAESRGDTDALLTSWRRDVPAASANRPGPRCISAAARSEERGWVAMLDDGRVVAVLHGNGPRPGDAPVTDDARTVARALHLADGPPHIVADDEIANARAQLAWHLAREWTSRSSGLTSATPRLRRAVQRRLDQIVAAAPRHRRGTVLALAARLRALLESPLPLGAERALAEVALGSGSECGHVAGARNAAAEADEEWLGRALELVARAPPRGADHRVARAPGVIALILLGR